MTGRPPNDVIESELAREDPTYAELVREFVKGLPARVSELESALAAGDFDQLIQAAHRLRGSGGGYGYPLLTDRAGELEDAARQHAIVLCRSAVEELKEIARRIVVLSAPVA